VPSCPHARQIEIAPTVARTSDRIMADNLEALRTGDLDVAQLAEHPATALAAVVHALALDVFFPGDKGSCLEIRPKQAWLSGHAPGIDESPAEQQTAERHAAWGKRLPKEPDQLWAFVAALDQGDQIVPLQALDEPARLGGRRSASGSTGTKMPARVKRFIGV
jgi:ParB family transcriptional regulator, chromosome partitioning protein